MKNYTLTIYAFGILILASCATSKMFTSNVKPNEVKDIQYLEPFSYITLIESGNRGKYNDTLSKKSQEIFIKAISAYKTRIPITAELFTNDTLIRRRIEREIEYLCVNADRQQSIANLRLTPVIDSLIKSSGKRFGLITVCTGFTRAKSNYGKEIAKGAALGLLTLGMYYQTPIKSNSTLYAMIVDAKENNIAFFRKSTLQDKEPLDENVLKKQLQDIFEGYFWITY